MMWKRDAKAAYRQVPVCPGDLWKCGCVSGLGLLIDTRLSFGVRMAPNKFQRLMLVAAREVMTRIHAFDDQHPPDDPALVRWLDERRAAMGSDQARLSAIIQYIDDGLAVSMNDIVPGRGRGRALFHMGIFDDVMDEAGIEMAGGDKRYESPHEIEALGVWVDVVDGSVSYPEAKRLRLTEFIQGLLDQASGGKPLQRAAVESLLGKEKWVAHVAPGLSSHLTSGFSLAHARGRPPTVVASESFLHDQRDILASLPSLPRLPLVPRSLFPEMTTTDSTVVFHDASGSFGVGGWFIDGDTFCFVSEAYPQEIQAAIRASPPVISISATELLDTSMMVALARERRPRAPYITSFTDNEAARAAATKGGSGSAAMAPVAERLARETADGGFLLRALRVSIRKRTQWPMGCLASRPSTRQQWPHLSASAHFASMSRPGCGVTCLA